MSRNLHEGKSLMLHHGTKGPTELEIWDYEEEEGELVETFFASEPSESVDLSRDLARAGYKIVPIEDDE